MNHVGTIRRRDEGSIRLGSRCGGRRARISRLRHRRRKGAGRASARLVDFGFRPVPEQAGTERNSEKETQQQPDQAGHQNPFPSVSGHPQQPGEAVDERRRQEYEQG